MTSTAPAWPDPGPLALSHPPVPGSIPVPPAVDRQTVRPGPGGPVGQADLLVRLRLREPEAWEELVRERLPRLLAVARRILRDEDAARDAVQEAFVAAHRNLERFAGEARLSTWLHRITVNAALMRLRSRGARPETSLDGLLPQFEPDGRHSIHPSSQPPAPEELLCRKETRTLVREAIDRLPVSYRTVILLRDIEELDTASTAELLGVSTTAVKVRLHRARQALRTLLENETGRRALA